MKQFILHTAVVLLLGFIAGIIVGAVIMEYAMM